MDKPNLDFDLMRSDFIIEKCKNKITTEDIDDLRSVINEQFDLIQRLSKTPLNGVANYRDYQTIYNDILECNKVMMAIISGPTGGIEIMVERTK